MTETPSDSESDVREHLSELEDGSSCTDIWEYLSAYRDNDAGS